MLSRLSWVIEGTVQLCQKCDAPLFLPNTNSQHTSLLSPTQPHMQVKDDSRNLKTFVMIPGSNGKTHSEPIGLCYFSLFRKYIWPQIAPICVKTLTNDIVAVQYLYVVKCNSSRLRSQHFSYQVLH